MASHGHHHATDSYQLDPAKWTTVRNVLAFVALLSWALLAFGYSTEHHRFFQSYLVAFCFGTFIILGATFFVYVQYLTGSAWSVTVRRIMENIMVSIPVGALLFIPIAFFGVDDLYKWAQADAIKDPLIQVKKAFLNVGGFRMRAGVLFALWSIWALAIWSSSTKQDKTKSIEQMKTSSRWSAPGLLLVCVTGCLAAFEWIMSLDPHWYSTIFGLYCLAGGCVAMWAVVTLVSLGFRSAGVLTNSITIEHYHDLGKWMFAISVFWTYLAASQYLLIWYANIPEETIYFQERMHGSWFWVSLLLPIGRFVVPFGLLISRGAKRNLTVLRLAAIWIILMEFVDMYWMIMPNFHEYAHGFHLHWLDLAAVAGVVSVYGLAFWSRFKSHSLVVEGDMRFEQGLHFHQV
jgi:hypothetical protein